MGPGGEVRREPSAQERRLAWSRGVIAALAALLVTAAVVLIVIIPTLRQGGTSAAWPTVTAAPSGQGVPRSKPEKSAPTKARSTAQERKPTADPPVVARPPAGIQVPTLVGLDRAAAIKAIKAAGLLAGAVSKVDSPQRIDQVLGSRPAGGANVAKGAKVTLQVSAGLPVPALAGMRRKAAESALTAAGLAAGPISRACSTQPDGQVLDTRPQAGRRVPGGTPVALVLARHGVAVPAVVGRAQADARTALSAAGLGVRVKGQVVEDESLVDMVLSQSVPAGTCAGPNVSVGIVVGVAGQTGPDPAEPTQTVKPPAGEVP
ncbi:PASTA domain-containing protein [Nonomuraea sp. NN258]|nr:PASTA domain-containing protein [Nonomuraea antri]